MKTIFYMLFAFVLLTSCYSHRSRFIRVDNDTKNASATSVYVADYDAMRRGTLIIKQNDKIKFVAEPPPDAAIQVMNKIKNSLSYKKDITDSTSNDYNETLTKLYNRTTSVSILRDALYRLSEINANNDGKKIDSTTSNLFREILFVAKEIEITNQKIIETEEQKIQLEKTKFIKADAFKKAEKYEAEGFEFLFNKNIEQALKSFEQAESIYPSFHNVFEIIKILKQNKKNSEWDKIYQEIYPKFKWKMKEEVVNKFEELTKSQ